MGLGFNDFTAGDVLTAAQVDGYLMRQSIMVFASTSARDTALSGNLEEGMFCFTTDTDSVWYYDGSAWNRYSTPWTSFTPSWTNLTTTSGTSVGRYIYTPDGIRVRASFVAGASSAITGAVSLTIPNSETSAATIPSLGNCLYFDSSTSTTYQGLVVCDASATAIDFFFENSELDATNPVAMQTSDQFRMDVVIQL